jgi:surface polysaccharide O-acyltransferase-like enzyme
MSNIVVNKNKRIDYIDALKGVAMLMVLIGHVILFCGLGDNNVITKNIVLINMPLFFMLNGLVINVLPPPSCVADCYRNAHSSEKRNNSMVKVSIWRFIFRKIISKCWQLLVPFFTWGFIGVVRAGGIYNDFLFNFWKLGYWYLLVLFEFFLVQTIIDAICLRLHGARRVWVDVLMFMVVYLVAKRIGIYGGTPIGILTDLWQFIEYLPYFYLGSLIRRYSLMDKISKHFGLLMTLSFVIIGVCYRLWQDGYFEDRLAYFIIVLRYAMVLVLVVGFLRLDKNIYNSFVGRGLCRIGRNTMIIYMFQFCIFKYINFGELFVYLYNSNNLFALVAIALVISIVIAWLCIAVGYILRLSPITQSILLGKVPAWLDARLRKLA